jgi:hypothetical protein
VVSLDPSQRGDPRQQLALVKRLVDEVICACLDRLSLLLVSARCDHDHWKERRARLATDLSADLVSVYAGHHNVEEDQVDTRGVQQLEGLLTR